MKENIPGYPGYHVTRDGKVYSCLIQGGSSKRGPWKLRYIAITKTGHEQIRLRTPTGFRSKGIHRLFSLGYTYKEIGRKVRLSPKVVSRFIRLRNSLD